VWCSKARALLVAALSCSRYSLFVPASSHKCGLLVASKHRLSACSFKRFDGATGMERAVFDKVCQPTAAAAGRIDRPGNHCTTPVKAALLLNDATLAHLLANSVRASQRRS
jgi:hypothetical protein